MALMSLSQFSQGIITTSSSLLWSFVVLEEVLAEYAAASDEALVFELA